MPRPRIPLVALAGLSVAALLAACSTTTAPPATAPDPTPASSYQPVTLDNCGHSVTFTSPPQKVVTVKSTSTELLLALGLRDHIVGEAFQDGPVADDWADQAQGIPILADQLPSQEAVLNLAPDFVLAGWESNFSADGIGTRDELEKLGIKTYVSPPACKEAGYKPTNLTFEDVFNQTKEVGEIFGVADRAAILNATQKQSLAGITRPEPGLTALWWSSGNDVPYVGAGDGLPQLILNTIGVANIAGALDDTWASMGWESIIAADPDVIVLVDASWNPASAKIKFLESNPATADMTAVKKKRYLVVPFPAAEAGVRSTEAAVDLSNQLAKIDFGS